MSGFSEWRRTWLLDVRHATDRTVDEIKTDTPWPLHLIVQELCESRGGRPGLSGLTSLLVSVDVKLS